MLSAAGAEGLSDRTEESSIASFDVDSFMVQRKQKAQQPPSVGGSSVSSLYDSFQQLHVAAPSLPQQGRVNRRGSLGCDVRVGRRGSMGGGDSLQKYALRRRGSIGTFVPTDPQQMSRRGSIENDFRCSSNGRRGSIGNEIRCPSNGRRGSIGTFMSGDTASSYANDSIAPKRRITTNPASPRSPSEVAGDVDYGYEPVVITRRSQHGTPGMRNSRLETSRSFRNLEPSRSSRNLVQSVSSRNLMAMKSGSSRNLLIPQSTSSRNLMAQQSRSSRNMMLERNRSSRHIQAELSTSMRNISLESSTSRRNLLMERAKSLHSMKSLNISSHSLLRQSSQRTLESIMSGVSEVSFSADSLKQESFVGRAA